MCDGKGASGAVGIDGTRRPARVAVTQWQQRAHLDCDPATSGGSIEIEQALDVQRRGGKRAVPDLPRPLGPVDGTSVAHRREAVPEIACELLGCRPAVASRTRSRAPVKVDERGKIASGHRLTGVL